MDAIFQFFFKYRPALFEQGELALRATSTLWLVGGAIALAAAASVVTYTRVSAKTSVRDRLVLAGLRLGALGLLLLCLLRPVLIVKAAVPQQNFVGVLIDDSRSMRIPDSGEGDARSVFVQRQLGTPESPLLAALSQRFVVRQFRFSSTTERIAGAGDLGFAGTQTRVGDALQRAHDDLAGLPVAGLVVVSDGADTSEATLGESLLGLKAESLPVFTIGVGSESVPRDVQVSRVATPRSVLKGSSLVVDIIVAATGFEGSTVPVQVEQDGRILSTEEVELPADGEPATVRVRFTAADAGPRVFRFRVPPQAGETITQNNVREALIDVVDRREKILYFEGEPRFEVKFIKRAADLDQNIQLVTLQRTSEAKFLRFGVDDGEELVDGFPKTREELFAYRGLILGSIESGAFTADQLRMIADFVNRRGGGLLMLGGARAFAEGGYAGTPVGEILPVLLDAPRGGGPGRSLSRLRVRPTRAGAGHAVTQIGKDEEDSSARWGDLPVVTSVNPIRRVKPGATILLTGVDERGSDLVALAFHRYGRGKAIVFPVQDSWNWQLHASIALEDMTHETYWRQMLRWLVDGVPGGVEATLTQDRVEPGQPVTITATVSDRAFVEVNDGRVVARVHTPTGKTLDTALEWTVQRDGEYRGTFVPQEEGPYEITVEADRGQATSLGRSVVHLRAGPGDDEYFDAAMRPQLLRRIAEETGGRFYPADAVASLAEDISHTGRGVTVVEERDLWDMPALLVLMMGLVLAEWTYRRARGLA